MENSDIKLAEERYTEYKINTKTGNVELTGVMYTLKCKKCNTVLLQYYESRSFGGPIILTRNNCNHFVIYTTADEYNPPGGVVVKRVNVGNNTYIVINMS